jgi:glutaconyl-CoA/methylmalonyl-CoA decarboxylase subunit gamma
MPKYKVTVGETTYEIEVGDVASSPTTIQVDGAEYEVAWESEKPAVVAPVARPAAPVPAPAPKPAAKPAAIAATGGETIEISAPMPGKILKVHVAPGDEVEEEQQVCSLEAMKMESAIQSTVAGVVLAVNVAPGDTVQYGNVLVVVEKRG